MLRKWVLTGFVFLTIRSDSTTESSEISKLEFLITNPLDPELYFNAMELICNEGYPVQQHKVISPDGYIINLHRIPNGNRKSRVGPVRRGYTKFHHFVHPDFYDCVNESMHERAVGRPVLLQHGLLAASDSWVLQGAGYDLAYLLADAGYDVWMSDARGNYYSRAHVYRSTNSKEFWDFSFHEIGYYDIPAVIDYILSKTHEKKVYYIGHSMGTTVFFVMGATRPEYMSKILLATLLAPVANVSTALIEPPRSYVSQFIYNSLQELGRSQRYEFAPRVNWIPLLINRFCSKRSLFQDLCYDIGISIDGHPHYNIIRKIFARAVAHFLSGSSAKTFYHFLQVTQSQTFRQYDFGEEVNFRKYKQVLPPSYNVSQVTCPVALIYSDADLFTKASQAEQLATSLPNVVFMKRLSQFIHTDFIVAHNAKEKVYDDVIALIRKY